MDKYKMQFAEGEEIPVEHKPAENLRRSIYQLESGLDFSRSKVRALIRELNRYSDDEVRTMKEITAIKKAVDVLSVGS